MTIIEEIVKKVEVGKYHERKQLHTIQKFLELDSLKNTDGFCKYDYVGLKRKRYYWIELKQRNIKYKQFSTIFINQCKIDNFKIGLKRNYKCYIFYLLIDGLYYIQITKKNVDKYDTRKIREQVSDDDIYIPMVAEIDMNDLIKC